jgi:hypothetical protein
MNISNFLTNILGMVTLLLVPESPYFLAWKAGNVEAARPR